MTDRDPPGVQVEQVRLLTDQPLPQRQAQAFALSFAQALDAAVIAVRPDAGRLRIRELVIDAGSSALQDAATLQRMAVAAAQDILDRTPE